MQCKFTRKGVEGYIICCIGQFQREHRFYIEGNCVFLTFLTSVQRTDCLFRVFASFSNVSSSSHAVERGLGVFYGGFHVWGLFKRGFIAAEAFGCCLTLEIIRILRI